MNWSGYEWIKQERWGQIHPDKSWCYNDPRAVQIDEYGTLHLTTKYRPKKFTIEGNDVISEYGIGLISSVENFGHGLFEIEAQLPTGKGLWPAFWIYGAESWPPEIDIFEAYSNKNGGYFRPQLWPPSIWNVQTNVHYGFDEDNTRAAIRGKQGWMGFKNPAKHFMKYECLWTPEYIKFMYNGHLVRTVTDKKVLDYMNNQKHRVIINNHLQESGRIQDQVTDFQIKSFKYTAL